MIGVVKANLYRQVGSRIRAARDRLSLTQQALADAVGLTRTSITNIEQGRQTLLLHKFLDIATTLQVNPCDLLPGQSALGAISIEEIVKDKTIEEQQFVRQALDSSNTRGHSRAAQSRRDKT